MKLAIVGLGMAAKPHIAALEELSDRITISGLYMRNAEKRKAAAEELGTAPFDSIDAIAADPDTDAVLVLTPPNARKELVAKLAAAGKHILMEKPLERSLEAATELVELAETAGIVTGTVFQHRARQGSLHLSRLLAEGALGDIAMVRTNVPWWRPQSYYDEPGRGTFAQDGGGVLITQAIHVLDLMLSLCGPVRSVQAMLATTAIHQMETEDFATAGVVYENGAVGSICATTAGFPGDSESIHIDASKGSAILEAGHLTLRWRDGTIEEFGEESASGGSGDPMAFPCAWHKAIIENFADCVDGKAKPICSWRDALDVQKLIDGMVRSSRLDGQRISL